MAGLVLLTPGTKVSVTSEHLMVQLPGSDSEPEPSAQRLPLVGIDHVVATDRVHITLPALGALLEREIPVVLVRGMSHRLIGVCVSPPPLTTARWLQVKRTEEPTFVRMISSAIVAGKIFNQRRVLQRLSANRAELVTPTLDALQAFLKKIEGIAPGQLHELRGIEGAAARAYFSVYAAFFPPESPMNGRSRQPPKDPPNAVLSYGYTMLYAEAICACYAAGLDPAVGFFHETAENRGALALDIIEPYRAPVADALALDLFSHRQLVADKHFAQAEGGVYLNTDGRKMFHAAYERRMQRAFVDPQTDEHTTLRTRLFADAAQLKVCIAEDRPFVPFKMP